MDSKKIINECKGLNVDQLNEVLTFMQFLIVRRKISFSENGMVLQIKL